MTETQANAYLIILAIFLIPAWIGRLFSGTNKKGCVANEYEECWARGVGVIGIATIVIFIIYAIITKIFY